MAMGEQLRPEDARPLPGNPDYTTTCIGCTLLGNIVNVDIRGLQAPGDYPCPEIVGDSACGLTVRLTEERQIGVVSEAPDGELLSWFGFCPVMNTKQPRR